MHNNHIVSLNWLQNYDSKSWELRKAARKNKLNDGTGKIELFNTYIKIHNYEFGDCIPLESSLVTFNKFGKVSWQNFLFDDEKKELIISGGINVSTLMNWFYCDPEDIYETDDKYDNFINVDFSVNTPARNEVQVKAINFLLSRDYFKQLKDSHQRILALKTGEGKTFCTIKALSEMKERSVIIIHNEGLIKQWKDSILQFTDIKEDEIYTIKGSSSVDKFFKNPTMKYKIFLSSHRTLANMALEKPNRLRKLFKRMKVGIKVFDESHKEQKAVNLIDFITNTKDTWYLTATPGRSNFQEQEIFKFCYATTPRYGESMRYEDPYHNVWLVNYNSNPSIDDQKSIRSFFGTNTSVYTDYCFGKGWDTLQVPFFHLLDKIVKKKGKIAILISKNEVIEFISDMLKERYDVKIGTYCTLISSKEERNSELDSKIILSTEKSLGTGMDIKNLKFLFTFIPIRSTIAIEQIMGRLRKIEDKEVYLIDFCDFGFDQIIRQRGKRLKLYKKKAKVIKTIDYRKDYEICRDNYKIDRKNLLSQ